MSPTFPLSFRSFSRSFCYSGVTRAAVAALPQGAEPAECLRYIDKALSLEPESSSALVAKAVVFEGSMQLNEAAELFCRSAASIEAEGGAPSNLCFRAGQLQYLCVVSHASLCRASPAHALATRCVDPSFALRCCIGRRLLSTSVLRS